MTSPASVRRPVTIVVAVALLALQAGGFGALAVGVALTADSTGVPVLPTGAIYPVVAFAAVVALGLVLIAWQLWRLRRWTRGAAVAWSLLLLLVAAAQVSVNAAFAVVVGLVAAATVVATAAAPTRLALEQAAGAGAEDDRV